MPCADGVSGCAALREKHELGTHEQEDDDALRGGYRTYMSQRRRRTLTKSAQPAISRKTRVKLRERVKSDQVPRGKRTRCP
jgi:hypothetical protein